MKKWLRSHKIFLIALLIIEALVLWSHITGLAMVLFFPAFILTMPICCGDYPSPELLFLMIQGNALAYAVGIYALTNLLSKKNTQ